MAQTNHEDERSPAYRPLNGSADDVVVVGRRNTGSEAIETEFTESDIANERTDTIAQLLAQLAPSIDPSGSPPVLLVNGKPVGLDQSILSFPPEALAKIAVLKDSAGSRYGAQPGAKVVNLVLKPKFASFEEVLDASVPTEGGQFDGVSASTRSLIDHDARWNAHFQVSLQSALFASSRLQRLLQVGDPPLLAAPSGTVRDIDTAGNFTTLLPATEGATFGLSYTRPVGTFSASVGIDGSLNVVRGEAGLPAATLYAPMAYAAASSGQLIEVVSSRAYRVRSQNRSVSTSFALTGLVRGVQANMSLNLGAADGMGVYENKIDLVSLQQAILEGTAWSHPTATFSPNFLLGNRNASMNRSLAARIELRKTLLKLPAGSATWTLNVSRFSGSGSSTEFSFGPLLEARNSFWNEAGRITLNLPLSSKGSGFGAIGNLTVDLSLGRQAGAESASSTSYAGGFAWSPFDQIQIDGSFDHARVPPSVELLDSPVKATVTDLFDAVTGVASTPIWTTGGNPNLRSGHQELESLSAVLRPIAGRSLSLTLGFRRSRADDNPVNFPTLTPDVEAAFPERVVRDSSGRLVSVDARPVNLARQEDASVDVGLAARSGSKSVGSASDWRRRLKRTMIDVSFTYRMRLISNLEFKQGEAVIDGLERTGQSRGEVDTRVNITKGAFGLSVSGDWRSPALLVSGDETFLLKQPTLVELGASIELDRLLTSRKTADFARHLRLSFSVQNLLDSRMQIEGIKDPVSVPYYAIQGDPLGRTLRASIRKLF